MNPNRFDAVTKLFADRRLSHRTATSTSLAAQDATPVVVLPPMDDAPAQLFVQAFQSGSIAPSTGEFGTHTVTLDHGMGQTIVFTDRPSREVFTAPTPAFLDGLGFPTDNPPNAAILMDAGDGTTDLAVVELFNPSYDEATHTATYDVAVLANWQNDLELGFQQEPADLSNVAPHFGATHLFIDGCSGTYACIWSEARFQMTIWGFLENVPATFWWDGNGCVPDGTANTHTLNEVRAYWAQRCNATFPACKDRCFLWF